MAGRSLIFGVGRLKLPALLPKNGYSFNSEELISFLAKDIE